ncbi:MAG: S41 family peptidase [Rickettsiales bacterium]|jgi:carboxyl-terminal processing protease|nr:S41 family peptidase [Rickettsiales bacterium]
MVKNFLIAFIVLTLIFPVLAADKKEKVEHLNEAQIYELMKKFSDVFEIIREGYVEEIDEKKALEAAINGMLTSLDPHSSYLPAEELKSFSDKAKGEFGGLGIQINSDKGAIRVISPMDGTPADRAGIKAGDYITHINGEQVGGITLNEAVRRMKGKPGTKVKLTIMKASGGKPTTIELKRAMINVESIKSEMRDGVAYIRISDFGAKTTKELDSTFDKLEKTKGGAPFGYVLDLRNNPGGYLTAAINVSDMFLNEGDIVSTRGRDKDDIDITRAKSGDKAKGRPVVVLINSGSASAAEIVAGALQDNRRAVVMGTKSFGKGSVQQQMPLGDGTAIHITIARYYTPSGRSIQAEGIEPDVEVLQSKVEVLESKKDIFSEATLAGALDKPDNSKDDDEDGRIRPGEKNDYQLTRAIDMVRALAKLDGHMPDLKKDDKKKKK